MMYFTYLQMSQEKEREGVESVGEMEKEGIREEREGDRGRRGNDKANVAKC